MNHRSHTKMDANTRLLLTWAHQLIEMITKVRGLTSVNSVGKKPVEDFSENRHAFIAFPLTLVQ